MNPKYKCTLKRDMAEAIKQAIENLLDCAPTDDFDKLHYSALREIRDRLYTKMINIQGEYTISLTPVQAFAIRILYTNYITNETTYLGNKLRQIAMDVHKIFN